VGRSAFFIGRPQRLGRVPRLSRTRMP
jgi:hypothetical protein